MEFNHKWVYDPTMKICKSLRYVCEKCGRSKSSCFIVKSPTKSKLGWSLIIKPCEFRSSKEAIVKDILE
jgi:hypothetical protein